MARSRQLSRRTFITWVGGAGAGFYLMGRLPGAGAPVVFAQVPGGSLDPVTIPKFQTPMLIPPVMPRTAVLTQRGGKPIDYYEISMRQFAQQILPAGFNPTTVWGYGGKAARSNRGLLIHHAPSLTIEVAWNRPIRIKWVNELVDTNGDYLPHLLPVDPTLHWANPPGGTQGRDSRPTFFSTPGPYTGPVPMVTHVHGAVGVADDSDGYAEAWYLPKARNIPEGYASEGRWYDFFDAKAAAAYDGATWGPGFATFQYPNANRASTIWYHDHALGMTRLNVYAGPAGFYLVRGGPDDAVVDGAGLCAAAIGTETSCLIEAPSSTCTSFMLSRANHIAMRCDSESASTASLMMPFPSASSSPACSAPGVPPFMRLTSTSAYQGDALAVMSCGIILCLSCRSNANRGSSSATGSPKRGSTNSRYASSTTTTTCWGTRSLRPPSAR